MSGLHITLVYAEYQTRIDFRTICDVTKHAHRTASFKKSYSVNTERIYTFSRFTWKQPSSAKLCTCIIQHSEAQTFSLRKKKKNTFIFSKNEVCSSIMVHGKKLWKLDIALSSVLLTSTVFSNGKHHTVLQVDMFLHHHEHGHYGLFRVDPPYSSPAS